MSNIWIYLLTTIHVFACIFLVIVVLLQSGKSADIAATFGGAGSQTAFGPRGAASALSRATTGAVIIFMFTSLTLSILSSRQGAGGGSVLDKYKPAQSTSQPAQQNAPAQPATPAPQKK